MQALSSSSTENFERRLAAPYNTKACAGANLATGKRLIEYQPEGSNVSDVFLLLN